MSATDELRRLLNERGVEWNNVFASAPRNDFTTFEPELGTTVDVWQGGSLLGIEVKTSYSFTPEQAVEATLGRETCENVGYYIDSTRFKCSACGYNGWTRYAADGEDRVPNYCPNCGRKVVDV